MRLLIVILLILVVESRAHGQSAPAIIGPQFDYSNSNAYNTGFGINIEGWFGKHFSLTYSFLYSPVGSDQYYIYTGGGQAAAVYIIKKAIKERSGLSLAIPVGIISFVLPESLAFRFPLTTKSQLGFFFAPYGFEFVKHRVTDEEDYNISYELGFRYYLEANKWIYILPQIGVKNFYGEDQVGVTYGLSVMFKIKPGNPDNLK